MNAVFTANESATLFQLLTDSASDILLKTDREGVVVHAMPEVAPSGRLFPREWQGRPLAEVVAPTHAAEIARRHRAAANGARDADWIELPAGSERHWFAMRMRPLEDEGGRIYGVLTVMRSIEDRRRFERELFVASLTDPLTGLSNRTAFVSMLRHLTETEVGGGTLAIFDIDHFKAINLRYGQAVGDDVLVAFANFVRASMRSQDIISRIGGESLGVLLPGASTAQAAAICRRVVESIAEIGMGGKGGGGAIPITASAGVARIARSVDETLNRAEVALALAKAKGRNRLELAA